MLINWLIFLFDDWQLFHDWQCLLSFPMPMIWTQCLWGWRMSESAWSSTQTSLDTCTHSSDVTNVKSFIKLHFSEFSVEFSFFLEIPSANACNKSNCTYYNSEPQIYLRNIIDIIYIIYIIYIIDIIKLYIYKYIYILSIIIYI